MKYSHLKNIIFILTILSYGCSPIQNIATSETELILQNIHKYRTDTKHTDTTLTACYQPLNIYSIHKSKNFTFFLNEKPILKGNKDTHSFHFQVFKDSFLLISYIEGRSGAAGPDLINREHTLILDLKTSNLLYFSLSNVHLITLKSTLDYYYNINNNRNFKYMNCIIESIDSLNNNMTLYSHYIHQTTVHGQRLTTPFLIQ